MKMACAKLERTVASGVAKPCPTIPKTQIPAASSVRARRDGAGTHQWLLPAQTSISTRMPNHEDVVEERRWSEAPGPGDACQGRMAHGSGGTGVKVSAVGHYSGAREGGRKSNFGTAAQVRAHLKYATKSSCREGSEEIITQVGD